MIGGDEVSTFVAPGIRRREVVFFVDEFIAEYGSDLSQNLLKIEYEENKSLKFSGEKGISFVWVQGEEWRSFMISKGWIEMENLDEYGF